LEKLTLPILNPAAEGTSRQRQGCAALRLSLCRQQIRKSLSLRQIQTAVIKCAACELAGFCATEPVYRSEGIEDCGYDGAAAVQMQFAKVFAGRTVGARKEEQYSAIEELAG
jgi:hypothetical protein